MVVEVRREDGRDLVTFSGLTGSGSLVSFVVSVMVAPEGRSICGILTA